MGALNSTLSNMTPSVTVSIVTYNGLRWLPGLFASLAERQVQDVAILVVDNASTDGTADWLREHHSRHPEIDLTVSDTNLGYAAGHNRNIERARSEIVVLLNQDLEMDAGYLGAVVEGFGSDASVGAIQGRVLRLGAPGERLAEIDTTGLVMQRDRRVVSRDQGADAAARRPPGSVWGVDGPAAAYRRAALEQARLPRSSGLGHEYLDEDFFMYKEDVDLAWRLNLLGWRTAYEPRAVAWHARTAAGPTGTSLTQIAARNRATPPWIRELSWRNQRLMQVKNDRARDVLRDLPWIARREILSFGYMVFADPRQLKALPGLVRLFPAALRKRRHLRARVTGR
jgi:GT2 family glycosyltransferase